MRQPWLQRPEERDPRAPSDDFSPASMVMPSRGAAVVLAVVSLLLLAGRSAEIVDALYGLPVLPGTDTLIALAEAWDALMTTLGLPELLRWLRGLLAGPAG